MTTAELLAQRAKSYGDFKRLAKIAEDVKTVMVLTPNWPRLRPQQRESLSMIAHKIARILNGDSEARDSWEDIAGYAQLIVNELEGKA